MRLCIQLKFRQTWHSKLLYSRSVIMIPRDCNNFKTNFGTKITKCSGKHPKKFATSNYESGKYSVQCVIFCSTCFFFSLEVVVLQVVLFANLTSSLYHNVLFVFVCACNVICLTVGYGRRWLFEYTRNQTAHTQPTMP